MAGNGRFESSSSSPEDSAYSGSYSNGQRGGYPGASLDRSGSFRETSESRMYSSGVSTPRGSASLAGDLPPINEYLNFEPISIENQKYTRLGELRRALGIISFGSTAEDNSFGAAHSKPTPAVATEELRRIKATVVDASNKAKSRKRMFDESCYKANKYYEALSLKKQQRNEIMTNERLGGLNLSKVGTPSSRNPAELMNQKLEDMNKNIIVNKRVRSSVAEIRAEGQNNTTARRMVAIGKDRATLRDCGEGSDLVDEKIRRLSVAGETWDIKMKRKRSVGPLLGRPLDEGEPKRVTHYKLNNDPGSTSSDGQTYRSGPFSGSNKFDVASLPASSNIRVTPKNELDKVSLSRDSLSGLSKERLKGSTKLNSHEDNQPSPNLSIKGKASRAPRSGPLMSGNLSPNFTRTSGSFECWEQPASINKIHSVNGAINRNRPIATGSSSPPMAQWVGQRPQKISRTRRANLVSPITNLDEAQMSPEDCSPSDLGTPVSGTNGSLVRGMANGSQQFKIKQELVSSPTRLSEDEESGICENRESRLREKGVTGTDTEGRCANTFPNTVPLTFNTKKSKIIIKEPGDGVRRQGRSGRGSSVSKVVKEKLESLASPKPVKSTRVGAERSGSKSGRPPLKKMSERKGVVRLGHINAIGSPDFSGEQDDDREELLEAANYACHFRNVACSGSFWKKVQSIFFPISLEDISYLKEQLKLMEVNYDSSSRMFGLHNSILNNCAHEDEFVSQAHVSGGRGKCLQDHGQDFESICGRLNSEERKNVVPLYQRVLSALIMEDEAEESEEDSGLRAMCFQDTSENSSDADFEARNSSRGPQSLHPHSINGFSYNDRAILSKGIIIPNYSSDDVLNGRQGVPHLGNGSFSGYSENGVAGPLPICTNASGVYSFNSPYEQLCMEDKLLLELQSVGLYPEIVPNLTDGEDEAITSDILRLEKELSEQVDKTKAQVKTIAEAAEKGHELEKRSLEQVAMDRLVELAYKKLLATRGSYASKHGLPKVPKPVAVAFMKKTLSRYRKFEETGKSCFSEPALRDIIYGSPLCGNGPESTNMPLDMKNSQQALRLSGSLSNWSDRDDNHNNRIGMNFANGFGNLSHSSEMDFAGPMTNRGKKKELLLDDVGGGSFVRGTNNLSGGAKGKRSERDRDKDSSVRNAKSSRVPNNKGDRKTKVKPKNKTGQLSSSGNLSINGTRPSSAGFGASDGNGSSDRKRGVESPNRNNPGSQATENEPEDLANLSTELGVANGLDDHQDFSTWFTEEEGLQEDYSMGLQIPMDDLFEVLS